VTVVKENRALVNRLRRVQGQLQGLERLIDGQADCRQVLTQLSAAKGALDQLSISLISLKLKECIDADGEDAKVDELLRSFLKGLV
jgi:CsoR family transcriptional regulator, copper-sensing transcriptional repressor